MEKVHITPASGSATISGRGLAHRRLNARQRACLAADVLDGLLSIKPTTSELANRLAVSATYIRAAQRLSPERRAAIIAGRDATSFAAIVSLRVLSLPAPKTSITDLELADAIRTAGIDRTLAVAAAVEQHAA